MFSLKLACTSIIPKTWNGGVEWVSTKYICYVMICTSRLLCFAGNTLPAIFPHNTEASFHPRYAHYKIHDFDKDSINADGHFKESHWSGVPKNEMAFPEGGYLYGFIKPNQGQRIAVVIRSLCVMTEITCSLLKIPALSPIINMTTWPLSEQFP